MQTYFHISLNLTTQKIPYFSVFFENRKKAERFRKGFTRLNPVKRKTETPIPRLSLHILHFDS